MSESSSSVGAMAVLLSIIPYRLGGLIPQPVALETHTKHGSFNLTSTAYLNVKGMLHACSAVLVFCQCVTSQRP